MHGFVYVVSNPVYAGLLKIGKSTRSPEIREAELSMHEGIPDKMKLEYFAFIEGDASKYENLAHKSLKSSHYNKEWFRVDLANAISTIRGVCGDKIRYEKIFNNGSEGSISEEAKRIIKENQIKIIGNEYKIYCRKEEEIFKKIIEDLESKSDDIAKLKAERIIWEKATQGERTYAYSGGSPLRLKFWSRPTLSQSIRDINKKLFDSIYSDEKINWILQVEKLKPHFKPKINLEDYVKNRLGGITTNHTTEQDLYGLTVRLGLKDLSEYLYRNGPEFKKVMQEEFTPKFDEVMESFRKIINK